MLYFFILEAQVLIEIVYLKSKFLLSLEIEYHSFYEDVSPQIISCADTNITINIYTNLQPYCQ